MMQKKTAYILILIFCTVFFSCSVKKSKPSKQTASIDSLTDTLSSKMRFDSLTEKSLLKALHASDSMNYIKGKVLSSVFLAKYYNQNRDVDVAYSYLKNVMPLIEDLDDPLLKAQVYLYIGDVYLMMNNFDVAYDFYSQSMEIYSKENQELNLSNTLIKIGNVFLNKPDYQKAFEYNQKAYALSKKYPNHIYSAFSLGNMAKVFLNDNKIDSALLYLNKAMAIFIFNKDSFSLAEAYNDLGMIEKKQGNREKAISYYNRSLKVNSSFNYTKADAFIQLGDVYADSGLTAEAIAFYKSGIGICDKHKFLTTPIKPCYELYKIYKKNKSTDSALTYLEKYKFLKDSLYKINNAEKLLQSELKYNFEKSLEERKNRQQNQLLYFLALVLFLILAIVILTLVFNKQKIKARIDHLEKINLKNELELKNKELSSQVLQMIQNKEKNDRLIESLQSQKSKFQEDNQFIIDEIISKIGKDDNKYLWRSFELRFEQVHNEFYKKLVNVHPDLTLNEKRLCAFLFLDLTTKEIASISGQTQRAIELARNRLRKKLGIESKTSFTVYFSNL
jgi:tetratricopeptide (TPR) repeat protein